jgi:hypothetical protein
LAAIDVSQPADPNVHCARVLGATIKMIAIINRPTRLGDIVLKLTITDVQKYAIDAPDAKNVTEGHPFNVSFPSLRGPG